ncbi:DUF4365 domain-containing protein [Yoonia sp. R2-816]|uniref:DUF4365 domain-containing protein n=1 Tax=Yoonia sp. R2-816 TaxID=3342638 RepID=UPI00372D65CC
MSIQEFERLLPSAWVCRRKDKDYGIDLEVEVFDETGRSTGLMFLVQLKATDSPKMARSVKMKVDRLEYMSSLDAPSMLVLYCAPSRTFHWLWLPEIFARQSRPSAETITIKFDPTDAWGARTSHTIPTTLRIFRTLRIRSRQLPIGLAVESEQTEANVSVALNAAMSKILGVSSRFKKGEDPNDCLPMQISFEGDKLKVGIDSIASVAVHLDIEDHNDIFLWLCYVVACMAYRSDFDEHLHDLASFIVRENLACPSRELASVVAVGVVGDSELAAAIASLNGLHEIQDESYARYIHALLSRAGSHDQKMTAINRFYEEAIAADVDQSDLVQAAIHYSFGDSLRIAVEMRAALRQFNLARRKCAEYLERAYFLSELRAILYFSGRYRLSARAYEASHAIEANAKTAICAGDALMFAAHPDRAIRYY